MSFGLNILCHQWKSSSLYTVLLSIKECSNNICTLINRTSCTFNFESDLHVDSSESAWLYIYLKWSENLALIKNPHLDTSPVADSGFCSKESPTWRQVCSSLYIVSRDVRPKNGIQSTDSVLRFPGLPQEQQFKLVQTHYITM